MKNIAVIFGGRSAEHDVSIITAHIPIITTLKSMLEYRVHPVYIARDGRWYSEPEFLDLTFFKRPDFSAWLAKKQPLDISFANGLSLVRPGLRAKRVAIDVAFPAMHGTYGEDGSLMGLLRLANVPFVGCDIFASAIAMDKVFTKQVAEANGILTADSIWLTRSEFMADRASVVTKVSKLGLPVFVKPVHLGSSIAVARADTTEQLVNALEVAVHYDDKVLVEKAVENLVEVTVPVMGNTGEARTGLVERALNESELFTFSDKYLHGGKKSGGKGKYSELPAKISPSLIKAAEQVALKTFAAIGGEGIARIDLLIDSKTKKVYMNEVNTLPGSLYEHNWKAAGVSHRELVTELIKLAYERAARQDELTITFDSTILSQI